MLVNRSRCRVSLERARSVLHFEMVLLSRMRAADVGIFLWKKERSRTRIARLTGGLNISSAIGNMLVICFLSRVTCCRRIV